MINWANVRFAECRVCGATLQESDLTLSKTDLCERCKDRCDRWIMRRCNWQTFWVVGDDEKESGHKHQLTQKEANDPALITYSYSTRRRPFEVGDIIEIAQNKHWYLVPEDVAVTEWVAIQLKKMAVKL